MKYTTIAKEKKTYDAKRPRVEVFKVKRRCIGTIGENWCKDGVCGVEFIADGKFNRLCPRCHRLARVYG